MSIGAGIVLFALGAIIAFALNVQVGWVDLDMLGYILMGAGVVIFLLGIVLMMRRRRSDVVTRTAVDPATDAAVSSRTTRTPDDSVGL